MPYLIEPVDRRTEVQKNMVKMDILRQAVAATIPADEITALKAGAVLDTMALALALLNPVPAGLKDGEWDGNDLEQIVSELIAQ